MNPSGGVMEAGGRWCLRCGDAGGDCTLSIAGAYDEVLEEGVAHWRRVHGARGEDAEVREAVVELMREQDVDWLSPREGVGDGRDAPSPRPDWPF